jgi:hypothetical protein
MDPHHVRPRCRPRLCNDSRLPVWPSTTGNGIDQTHGAPINSPQVLQARNREDREVVDHGKTTPNEVRPETTKDATTGSDTRHRPSVHRAQQSSGACQCQRNPRLGNHTGVDTRCDCPCHSLDVSILPSTEGQKAEHETTATQEADAVSAYPPEIEAWLSREVGPDLARLAQREYFSRTERVPEPDAGAGDVDP